MSRFSTTVHIKNNVDRMRFVNTFSDIMKKRGFVPCSEDETAQSYIFAYDDGWVTLANEEYMDNPQKAYDDTRDMAKALKTSAFSVEVVDSDFAIMTLRAPNGAEDRVVVGDGTGYGIEETPMGDKNLWEPFLAEGRTLEELYGLWNNQDILAEDTLRDVAPILGINPYYIYADYNEISEKADENENIIAFYFKKAVAKTKSMSLNAAFIKVFGEALEPLGFKKIKSRYPYLVRVVPGGEIIHVITVMQDQGMMQNQKSFVISGGVATVYRGKIDLSISPRHNSNWLLSNVKICQKMHPFEDNSEMFNKLHQSNYVIGNYDSMIKELTSSLSYTQQFLLPVLNNVTNLFECADYCWKFFSAELQIFSDDDWGAQQNGGQESEGLMLLKIYDTNAYKQKYQKQIDISREVILRSIKDGTCGYSMEDYNNECQLVDSFFKRNIAAFNRLTIPSKHRSLALDELERRKMSNREALHKLGVNV